MNGIVIVENLVKSYGKNTAVKNISFSVKVNEVFGLLGTNGAGKTTTLECIEGLCKYDGGTIKINGKVGVQLQSSSLPPTIKGIEAYRFFNKWNRNDENLEEFNKFGLSDIKNKQYKDMSTGQKRRLHLTLATIGNPDILVLDEPTAGLDVEGRVSLHEDIKKFKKEGKTIIIASHDMAEVEELCDRIAILKDGEIGFLGETRELMSQADTNCNIYIKTQKGEETFNSNNIADTLLTQLENYKNMGIDVLDIQIKRQTLEQKFINLTKESK